MRSLLSIVFISLILLVSACNDNVLYKICNDDCAIMDDGTIVTNEDAYAVTCHTGKLICKEDGTAICQGWAPIGEEHCRDGHFDNDCDGDPDNAGAYPGDSFNDCVTTQLGVCRHSIKMCINDDWVCMPPPSEYGAERCDGLDNDCDGLIDNDDPDLVSNGPEWIYEGPPETLNVGECRAGKRTCEDGIEFIFGQVLPTKEICGNDDDDDCDGLTDEPDGDSLAEAFLLDIDFSGSMGWTIEGVITALCSWSSTNRFINSKFAIMSVGNAWDDGTLSYLDLVTDFVDPIEACTLLEDYYWSLGANGGVEYIPYSILATQTTEEYAIHWPIGLNRRVVFFTDEEPQGYLSIDTDELNQVGSDCQTNNYTVGGFTKVANNKWNIMTQACGGWLEYLSDDPDQLQEDLDYRFGGECN